jgi:hypothetical protein
MIYYCALVPYTITHCKYVCKCIHYGHLAKVIILVWMYNVTIYGWKYKDAGWSNVAHSLLMRPHAISICGSVCTQQLWSRQGWMHDVFILLVPINIHDWMITHIWMMLRDLDGNGDDGGIDTYTITRHKHTCKCVHLIIVAVDGWFYRWMDDPSRLFALLVHVIWWYCLDDNANNGWSMLEGWLISCSQIIAWWHAMCLCCFYKRYEFVRLLNVL